MGLQSQSLRHPPAISTQYPASPPRDYNIAAVDRTLDLLEALSRLGPPPRSPALAESAGCTRTAAFRLLRDVARSRFSPYRTTRAAFGGSARDGMRLDAPPRSKVPLAATSHANLGSSRKGKLARNVYLRVREGMESETVAIYPDRSNHPPCIQRSANAGPLHAGSSRILLAFAPEAVQTQLLAQRLNRYTPATRIDPTWIAADLQRISRARVSHNFRRGRWPAPSALPPPIRDAGRLGRGGAPHQCAVHGGCGRPGRGMCCRR